MKISEKQLQIMLRVLEGSTSITDGSLGLFGYSQQTRSDIFKQIINQQSDKLIDIKEEPK